ncbi:ribosomal protein S18 acetylase RimI-like enzyme [Saccharothrix tamanrassetensis]|uniref:Ribosomal protein S18 acetylase RimI-like enzyme n=1 Tax=Saccharothrix tamanrassetensis TaxID=1051531 RepID=A0A841CL27_9PSEU|nr:GNAT family N-acetyltransferase [Saccharothrix tamanrassetensis]MBB5957790.1 ribosomal protein S18 acetylase RimI-like enzyme [Saccharothrix tamanrassetensis]
MLADIQAALRDSIRPDAEQVGPFLVRFDAHSDNVYMNYAVPEAGATPTAADVADLVEAFRARSRTPRLEYLRPSPAVDAALDQAGFTVDQLQPMMGVDRADLRVPDVPDGVELVEATSDDELVAVSEVQNRAFGVGSLTREAAVHRQRGLLRHGGLLLLALARGEPAGGGSYTGPQAGLSQVAGIGVLPEYRNQGIASAICGELTARVFAAGNIPFLETEPDGKAGRLYGPIGYRTIGESTSISLK